jgi:hypothetical protein
MATSIYELKAAAHLNNIAVSLFLSRSYLKGMITLSDAVSIISDASSRQAQTQAGSQAQTAQVLPGNDNFAAIQERLRTAAERLSNPEPFQGQQDTNIAVLAHGERPTCVLANVTYLILIDVTDFDEATYENDLAVTTSIIFYNYAIAYRCLSSLSTASMPNAKEHDSRALRLLHLSEAASRKSCTSPFNRSHLVNLLALHNLVQLSHQLGFDEGKRNEYATRLGHLLHIMCRLEALEGQLPARHACAA